MYRDSVGNTYRSLPTRKPTRGAKSTKSGFRGDRAAREKYLASQRTRTAANVARRRARHMAAHPNDKTAIT